MAGVEKQDTDEEEQRPFVFRYPSNSKVYELKVPLKIPYSRDVRELAMRLIRGHDLPCYLEDQLVDRLRCHVQETTQLASDSNATETMQRVLDEDKVEEHVKQWVERYTENHTHFSALTDSAPNSANQLSNIYHTLIHSHVLTLLLQLEHIYTVAIDDICKARDNALKVMQRRHDDELQLSMAALGTTKTDRDINTLMRKHVEERESLETKWEEELKQQMNSQKEDYRDWLVRLHQEMMKPEETKGKKKSALEELQAKQSSFTFDHAVLTGPHRMEESFTIHLGAQLKSSHNLRILSGDVLLFCRQSSHEDDNPEDSKLRLDPQHMQTAMSLYTSDLVSLIVMTSSTISSVTGLEEAFADICRHSTDFHFPSVDEQQQEIQQFATHLQEENALRIPTPVGERSSSRDVSPSSRSPESPSLDSSMECDGSLQSSPERMTHLAPPDSHLIRKESSALTPGSFYLTRHSNLSQVHVVFHLVTDERAVQSASLSAHHPVMQGLKNCLRTAGRHSIRTVTLPLLLVHKMTPDMTINWCLKRAEMVFKSVKGFMLENSSWRGNQSWNIQFLIPEGVSADLFEQISDLLPKTFRIAVSRDLTK